MYYFKRELKLFKYDETAHIKINERKNNEKICNGQENNKCQINIYKIHLVTK